MTLWQYEQRLPREPKVIVELNPMHLDGVDEPIELIEHGSNGGLAMKFGMAYKHGVRGRMSTLIDNEY